VSSEQPTPIVFTLTLPDPGGEGTLLIQRGDLAHLCQFAYTTEMDFTTLIQQALAALTGIENNPPIIPDELPRKTAVAAVPPPPPAEPPEPMIQIPTKAKKGTATVPARRLRIVGGETDEAAQQQAVKIAGRLLDSGLWDGKIPIGIDDVYAVQRRLDGLTDKELKLLFTLEQFVQINPGTPSTEEAPDTDDSLQDSQDDTPVLVEMQDTSD
jgi:hypothetical protein